MAGTSGDSLTPRNRRVTEVTGNNETMERNLRRLSLRRTCRTSRAVCLLAVTAAATPAGIVPPPSAPRARLLTSPIAGQDSPSRTDAGQDYSNIRGKIVSVASGTISNVYAHLSGFATTVIEHLTTPVNIGGRTYTDVYYGLESGGGTPTVTQGEQVQQGTEIAPGLGSGGIEVGFWDTSTGRAVGHYTEGGPPTQAGLDFAAATGGAGSTGIVRPGGQASGSGGSGDVQTELDNYITLRDMPRTAPPNTKNPFQWWWASFTGDWDKMVTAPSGSSSGGGTGTGAPTSTAPGGSLGQFIATAYGPPWGGIEGGGQTATGVDLSNAPHDYIVAVDPSVIPLHTKLKINPNPFGDPNIIFSAEDTGGAIKGDRIDFYDWRGRSSQDAWGRRPVAVSILT